MSITSAGSSLYGEMPNSSTDGNHASLVSFSHSEFTLRAIAIASIMIVLLLMSACSMAEPVQSEPSDEPGITEESSQESSSSQPAMTGELASHDAAAEMSFTQASISAGTSHTIGLRTDGTVVAIGDNIFGVCELADWKDMVGIASGRAYSVGLCSDGTVVAVGDNEYGQCDVDEWEDITAISVGSDHTVGLRSDGTVVATGPDFQGQCDVGEWKDITAVSAGPMHTVGLRSDGTVVATGNNDYGQCEVDGWKDITAVSAGSMYTVGLRSDGTVVAVGSNEAGQCDVDSWKDITAISAGKSFSPTEDHTVGLRSDGTVVATGCNNYGQCDVNEWEDISVISAGSRYTVGLRSDGTVVATGNNESGECDVTGWKLSNPSGAKSDGTASEVTLISACYEKDGRYKEVDGEWGQFREQDRTWTYDSNGNCVSFEARTTNAEKVFYDRLKTKETLVTTTTRWSYENDELGYIESLTGSSEDTRGTLEGPFTYSVENSVDALGRLESLALDMPDEDVSLTAKYEYYGITTNISTVTYRLTCDSSLVSAKASSCEALLQGELPCIAHVADRLYSDEDTSGLVMEMAFMAAFSEDGRLKSYGLNSEEMLEIEVPSRESRANTVVTDHSFEYTYDQYGNVSHCEVLSFTMDYSYITCEAPSISTSIFSRLYGMYDPRII